MNTTFFSTLHIEIKNQIAIVCINRPNKLNAINEDVIKELEIFITEFHSSKSVNGAIITGKGEKAFVAGADISELEKLTPEEALHLSQRGQKVFLNFELSPKPIIAVINGFALGGGCELAMACHIRIACTNATFSLPEINLGVLPGYGGTVRLPHIVGKSKAIEMMLSGNMLSSDEALSAGLVSYVLEKDKAMDKAVTLLENIVKKSPLVIKKILNLCHPPSKSLICQYNDEASAFSACYYTEDTKEGISAFLQKRKPKFKGK